MLWWRIELDRGGAITKVDQVEAVGKESALITYVEAASKVEACSFAKHWHERRLANARAKGRARYGRLCASGVCVMCGAARARDGKRTCEACKRRNTEQMKRFRAGKRNGTTGQFLSPEESLERHRAEARKQQGQRVRYTVVLARFDELGPANFRLWLTRQIAVHDVRDYSDAAQAAE